MPKITPLFAHPIYEVDFPNYSNIQESLVRHITSNFHAEFMNEYHGHDHPIRNGALTIIYDKFKYKRECKNIEDQNLKSIFDFITEHGKAYWKELGLSNMLDPYVLQLWATATKKGGFVASHNHNPIAISGVFYLEARPEQGNLFVENPLDLLIGKSPRQIDSMVPSRLNYEIVATSGKLVLFPGWMKHFTRPNPTDDVRMSMAVNFGCEGQVYFTEFS
jgi:uncharacterized protein (TIGR02466 family)